MIEDLGTILFYFVCTCHWWLPMVLIIMRRKDAWGCSFDIFRDYRPMP